MLVPPRVGEMAAYASLRQDSFKRPTTIERRPSRFRLSLQRLSRFVDRRPGRSQASSHHPLGLGITIDSSDSSTSGMLTESDFGEVQSVTTFGSGETLHNDVLDDKLYEPTKERGLLVANPEKFPRSVCGTKAKLALSPSLLESGIDISQIDIQLRNGERLSWCRQTGIAELPKAIRKKIWRKAIVHDRKLFICSCYYCQANGVVATQPSLTCTFRAVRAETLPIFYQENQFQHPLAHPDNSSVRGWLNSIGPDNRSLLRHLELTFLNTERAITSLDVHYQMQPVKESVVVENFMWDDGQSGEMEWHVFTALESGIASKAIEEDAQSIGTSILFDLCGARDDTNELEFDAADCEDDWETMKTSGESSRRLLAPTTPPQVHLTRKNGEAFGNPRWSFAAKFNDHVVQRLASLSRDPYEKKPRKPVAFTVMPDLVVASDRSIEDDH